MIDVWCLEDTSCVCVFCSVSFNCKESLAVILTTWKSEKATPRGLWLVATVETWSPPTTPLWLVTSCGLSLSQTHPSAEQDSEPPSHTVSVYVWGQFTSLVYIKFTEVEVAILLPPLHVTWYKVSTSYACVWWISKNFTLPLVVGKNETELAPVPCHQQMLHCIFSTRTSPFSLSLVLQISYWCNCLVHLCFFIVELC